MLLGLCSYYVPIYLAWSLYIFEMEVCMFLFHLVVFICVRTYFPIFYTLQFCFIVHFTSSDFWVGEPHVEGACGELHQKKQKMIVGMLILCCAAPNRLKECLC